MAETAELGAEFRRLRFLIGFLLTAGTRAGYDTGTARHGAARRGWKPGAGIRRRHLSSSTESARRLSSHASLAGLQSVNCTLLQERQEWKSLKQLSQCKLKIGSRVARNPLVEFA